MGSGDSKDIDLTKNKKDTDLAKNKKDADDNYNKSREKLKDAEAHVKAMAIAFLVVSAFFYIFYIKNAHVAFYNFMVGRKQKNAAQKFEQIMAGDVDKFKTFDSERAKTQKRKIFGHEKLLGMISFGEVKADETSKELLKKLKDVNDKRQEYIKKWNENTYTQAQEDSKRKATLLYYHTGFIVPFGVMGFYPDHWSIDDAVGYDNMLNHPIGKIEGEMAAQIRDEQNIYPPIFDNEFIPWPDDEDIVEGKLTAFKALNMELTPNVSKPQPRYIIALDSSIMFVQIKREKMAGAIRGAGTITYGDMEKKYGISFYKERAEWYYTKINLSLTVKKTDFKRFTDSDFHPDLKKAITQDAAISFNSLIYGEKKVSDIVARYLSPFYNSKNTTLSTAGTGAYTAYDPNNLSDRNAVYPPIEITYNEITRDLNLFSVFLTTYDEDQRLVSKLVFGKTALVKRNFIQVPKLDVTSRFLVEKIPFDTEKKDGRTGLITEFHPENTRNIHQSEQKNGWGLDFSKSKYGTCSNPVPMDFFNPVKIGDALIPEMYYNLIPLKNIPEVVTPAGKTIPPIYYIADNITIESQEKNAIDLNNNRYLAKTIDSKRYRIYAYSTKDLAFEISKNISISNNGTEFNYYSKVET